MRDSDFKHNFHTHTYRCKHATGDVDDYCQAALAMGMETLGFSDHCALPNDRWLSIRMKYTELDEYVAAVHRAQEAHATLRILLGMECEYLPEFHQYYEDELLGQRQFDYLIGGAHFFPDENDEWVGTYGGTTSRSTLLKYSSYVTTMMASGLFDFIAHPDLFGNCYATWDANTIACSREILSAAADHNVGLEINAYGLRKIAAKPSAHPFPLYPWRPFWELAAEYDVKVIVNSDAHAPEDLQGMTAGAELIRSTFGLVGMDPHKIGSRE